MHTIFSNIDLLNCKTASCHKRSKVFSCPCIVFRGKHHVVEFLYIAHGIYCHIAVFSMKVKVTL